MKYAAFTICIIAVITLVFFLRSNNLPPPSDEQVAQVEQYEFDERFEPATPLKPVKPEEPNSQHEGKYPCPNYPMPHDNLPHDGEDSKMIVRPDDKVDYKMIVIDPCLPSSVESKEKKSLTK